MSATASFLSHSVQTSAFFICLSRLHNIDVRMLSLFRSTKILVISQAISQCKDDEVQVLINTFKEQSKEYLITVFTLPKNTRLALLAAFMSSKSKIPNQLLDTVVSYINTNLTINENSNDDIEACEIELLPQDVFNTIGSYLDLKSSIRLSSTNCSIFIMVQNDEYFSQIKRQTEKLVLTPELGNIIISTNANMECYKKCKKLYISSICDEKIYISKNTVSCKDDCFFAKLASRMQSEHNYNYDLQWFKTLLLNVDEIYWSIRWTCILNKNHIPISWIFDKNIINSNCKYNINSESLIFDEEKDDNNYKYDFDNCNLKPTIARRYSYTNGINNNNDNDNNNTNNTKDKQIKTIENNSRNVNNINNNNNGLKIHGLTIVHRSSYDHELSTPLTQIQHTRFVEAYDKYFESKLAIIKAQLQYKDSNINSEKFPFGNMNSMNEKEKEQKEIRLAYLNIRKLKDMRIDANRFSINTFSKLHGNYGELTFSIPPRVYWTPYASLDEFYKVFHKQLGTLRIRCHTIEIYDLNIVSQLFGPSSRRFRVDSNIKKQIDAAMTKEIQEFINDLNTNEEKLSFKSFLKKQGYTKNSYNYVVPQIRSLSFSITSDYAKYNNVNNINGYLAIHKNNSENKGIISLVKHDKLMKLFNFGKTIKQLDFGIVSTSNKLQMKAIFEDVIKVVELLGPTMKKLKNVDIRLRPKQTCKWDQFSIIYDNYIDEILLNCCLLQKLKCINIVAKHSKNMNRNKYVDKWNINLDSSDLLLSKNKMKLKEIIVNQTKQSKNLFKKQWNKMSDDIKSGKCLVKHSFILIRSFRV